MIESTDIIAGPFTLNGVTVAFAFTFKISSTSDLKVVVTETDGTEHVLTLTTHYAVTATNNDFSSGGTVTITTTIRDLYTTGTITIYDNLSFLQESEYTPGDDLDRDVLEEDFDKAVRRDLNLLARIERVLQVPFTDTQAGSLEIPDKATRSSKILGFDADGLPIAVAAISSALVSSFMETVLDDTTAGAVLTTLGLTAFIQTLVDDADAATARATLAITQENLGFAPEQGYNNLSMTNMDATTEPTFTGSVEVNGTLVTLSAASGTGFSGLSTSSDVWVYVQSDWDVVYAATAPAWDSAKGGWYNSNDRAVAWMRKDSADGYRYKHFLPQKQETEISFTEFIEIGDWNMDTGASPSGGGPTHELDMSNIRFADVSVRDDSGQVYQLTYNDGAGTEAGLFYVSTTRVEMGRTTGGQFDSANFDSTSYNRGWAIVTHVVL